MIPSHTTAAVLFQQGQPLRLINVSIPELEPGHVLVKVECSAVCGTQLEEIDGKRGEDAYLPHMLGHEGAGTVVKVGPGVRKVKDGDHVVLHWMKGSGIESVPPRFVGNDIVINAGWITTFSGYTVVSENRVTQIEDNIRFDVATLLGCSVTTGLGIVFNDADVKPGQSIAVFGAGGVGMNVVQGASLVNAYPIVAVDLHDIKLRKARDLGATQTVKASDGRLEALLMELSEGRGFDVTVDTTGNPGVRQLAYRLTGRTGKAVLAAVPHHQAPITIDSYPLNFGRSILGSYGGQTQPDTDIPRYVQLYKLGRLKLDELITHRYRLDQINEAVDRVRTGQAGRCLIEMS